MNANLASKRNLNIDLLKTIAMLGVICLHTTRVFAESSPHVVGIASILYRTAVISIPMFFLVSGYLLCPRREVTYRYVARKIYRIIRYILIFCVAYWLICYVPHGFNLKSLLVLIYNSFIGVGPYTVFWYFSAYIGLLLLLPLIVKIYQKKQLFMALTVFLLVLQNCEFLQNLTIGGVVKPLILHLGIITGLLTS